jgi:hypothetical protein
MLFSEFALIGAFGMKFSVFEKFTDVLTKEKKNELEVTWW